MLYMNLQTSLSSNFLYNLDSQYTSTTLNRLFAKSIYYPNNFVWITVELNLFSLSANSHFTIMQLSSAKEFILNLWSIKFKCYAISVKNIYDQDVNILFWIPLSELNINVFLNLVTFFYQIHKVTKFLFLTV